MCLALTTNCHTRLSLLMALTGLRFKGLGWEKLICDYDLCYGDIIKLDLQGDDFFFHIDMMLSESRGSRKAVPKTSVGMLYLPPKMTPD